MRNLSSEHAFGSQGSGKQRIGTLDGLRGLAILLVVALHYFYYLAPTATWFPLLKKLRAPFALGWTGVDLFFVLSGFLLGGILLDNRDSTNYFRVFYTRRALRILPLYLVLLVTLAAGVIALHFGVLSGAGWTYLFGNRLPPVVYATFTQNFFVALRGDYGPEWSNVTWSLAVEEQFYFVLPLLLRLLPPKRRRAALIALIGLAPLIRAILIVARIGVPREAAYALFPARMDSLFLGVLLAVLFRGEEGGGWLRTVVNSRYWVLVSMLALIPFYFYSPLYRSVPAIFGYTIFAFFYAGLLIHAVARDGSPPNRLCRIRSLQRTGRLAYGIYLFHMPVLGLLFAISRNTLPNMETPAALGLVCVALAITLLLADFSFRLLEQPLIRYGHRWRYAKAEADPPKPG